MGRLALGQVLELVHRTLVLEGRHKLEEVAHHMVEEMERHKHVRAVPYQQE